MLISSVAQGIMWTMMAIGVYITFRLLDIADLTAEGSFPLGAAVCIQWIATGHSALTATLLAIIAGALAGVVTGLLHTVLKIPALLAGILTMTALYSINLHVMGKANVALTTQKTIFDSISFGNGGLWVALMIMLLTIFILQAFFKTIFGLGLLATGINPVMSEANGIHTHLMKIIGYAISNGLIALSGALIAQNNGFADVTMGIGTIVIGLASVIVAEVILHNVSLNVRFVTLAFGAILYRVILDFVMSQGVNPIDLKLISAVLLVACLSLPLIEKALNRHGIKMILSRHKAVTPEEEA